MVQKEDERSNKINEGVLIRSLPALPNFRWMKFGPGRLIAYLSMSGKKKRRMRDCSSKRKRKYNSLGSIDQGDLGPSTSADTKAEPAGKIHCSSSQSKNETDKGSESRVPTILKMGLTGPEGCSSKRYCNHSINFLL